MRIKILYDNTARDGRLATGWGFACVVDDKILFDTGGRPDVLLSNMKVMGVDCSHLDAVIISHDHWDHQGGLRGLLEAHPGLTVYACPHFSGRFKTQVTSREGRLVEIGSFAEIAGGVYSTGEISGKFLFRCMPEQALVLKTDKGMTVITGCAHPGVVRVVQEALRHLPGRVHLVLGGFHLIVPSGKALKEAVHAFRRLQVERVAPTHCTGARARAAFKEEYGADFIEAQAGSVVDV